MSIEIRLVESALGFYRYKKPGSTEACVVNGRSCSQRFEDTMRDALNRDMTPGQAISQEVLFVVDTCVEINEFSRPEALATLVGGTIGSVVGLPLGACNCRPEKFTQQVIGDASIVYRISRDVGMTARAAVESAAGVLAHPKKHGFC